MRIPLPVDAADDPGCLRALNIELADLIGEIDDCRLAAAGIALQVGADDTAHAGIDHHHEERVVCFKNNRIVDDLAGFVQEDAVHASTGGQRLLILSDAGGQVFGKTDLQEVSRPLSLTVITLMRLFKIPAWVKTTRCSSLAPLGYHSGMS